MAAEVDSGAGSGGRLSRERVLREAVRLADAGGLEGLSMRRLARELGAGAMSLYYHVANKDELLDGMVDLVFEEIDLLPTGADWKLAMRQRAVSARDALARHPWAINLMESRTAPGPANLRHREAVTACLRQAGFSVEMATHANWLIDSHILGYALQEATLPFDTAEELAEMVEDVFLPQIPPEQYPYLNEAAATLMATGYDPAQEFTWGLDLILDALERVRASH